MRKKIFVMAIVWFWLLGMSSFMAYAGGVFVTGHDPDYHANAFTGGNPLGAQHIIQRAIAYVTFDNPSPRILLVTDLRNPNGNQSDSRLGMSAAGFTFDVADFGSGTPGVLDLNTVDFNNYDAILVASDYGGWLRQVELDILNARSAELIMYVNTGNRGIVAFNESGNRIVSSPTVYPGTTHNRYGFLPFLVSEVPLHQDEVGFTVTPAGTAMGLTDADVNGNASHSFFTATGGMDVIDIDATGRAMSLATRKTVTPGGVVDCTNGLDDDGDGLIDCDDPDCANHPACQNNPPDCSGAYPSLLTVWPPNHQMVNIDILGVADLDGDPVTITITGITQDEPTKGTGTGSGNTCPDGGGVGTSTAQIRAERAGTPRLPGNGRVYKISFKASDGKGGECTGVVEVCVQHDQRPGNVCIDDGQVYNSTVCQ